MSNIYKEPVDKRKKLYEVKYESSVGTKKEDERLSQLENYEYFSSLVSSGKTFDDLIEAGFDLDYIISNIKPDRFMDDSLKKFLK